MSVTVELPVDLLWHHRQSPTSRGHLILHITTSAMVEALVTVMITSEQQLLNAPFVLDFPCVVATPPHEFYSDSVLCL